MLPLKNRLKKENEIKTVLKKGLSFKEDALVLKKIENNSKESRFGFIVPQEISKKSTLRNKLKRRLREVVRKKFKEIKIGLDIIFIALPGLEEKKFYQLEEVLQKIFLKAKILK